MIASFPRASCAPRSLVALGLDNLVITTHDVTMKSVAEKIGFRITDPVE
jgi:uncharacterized protein